MSVIHVHDRIVMSWALLWPVVTRARLAGEGLDVISRAAKVLAAAARIDHPLHLQPGTGTPAVGKALPTISEKDPMAAVTRRCNTVGVRHARPAT